MSDFEPNLENEKTPLPGATAAGLKREGMEIDDGDHTPFAGSVKAKTTAASERWAAPSYYSEANERRESPAMFEARYRAATRGGVVDDYLPERRAAWSDGYKSRLSAGEGELEDQFYYMTRDNKVYARIDKFRDAETGRKGFFQFYWVERWPLGRWVRGEAPGGRIPYYLEYFDKALAAGGTISFAEGEKDAESVYNLGELHATAVSDGARAPFTPELAKHFEGFKRVFILADNDAPGRAFAPRVASVLIDIVPEIRIVHFPDVAEGGDVSDWIEARKAEGLDRAQIKALLLARVEEAPRFSKAVLEERRRHLRGVYDRARQERARKAEQSPGYVMELLGDALVAIRRSKPAEQGTTLFKQCCILGEQILAGRLNRGIVKEKILKAASHALIDRLRAEKTFEDALRNVANNGGVK